MLSAAAPHDDADFADSPRLASEGPFLHATLESYARHAEPVLCADEGHLCRTTLKRSGLARKFSPNSPPSVTRNRRRFNGRQLDRFLGAVTFSGKQQRVPERRLRLRCRFCSASLAKSRSQVSRWCSCSFRRANSRCRSPKRSTATDVGSESPLRRSTAGRISDVKSSRSVAVCMWWLQRLVAFSITCAARRFSSQASCRSCSTKPTKCSTWVSQKISNSSSRRCLKRGKLRSFPQHFHRASRVSPNDISVNQSAC